MSEQRPRAFSTELKEQIVLRLEAGERISAVADETGIRRKLLYQWRDAYRAMGMAGFNRKRGPKQGWKQAGSSALHAPTSPTFSSSGARPTDELARAKARIAELERTIGRQQVDLDFFQRALRLWDATSPSGAAPTSTRSSKK
jgi:transposase